MSKPEIGAGDVNINLAGNDIVLKPTLFAVTVLSRGSGGLTRLATRCLDLEFSAIQEVIVAGMGGKGSKDLPEMIYQAGIINLSEVCIRFINNISNGGRPLGDDDNADSDDKGETNSPLDGSSQQENTTEK